MTTERPKKGKRGFASMTPQKRKQIASMGGVASQKKGTAHRFSPDEVSEMGRKGGKANKKYTIAELRIRALNEYGHEPGIPGGVSRVLEFLDYLEGK